MIKLFVDSGWTAGKTMGSHTKWHCPGYAHSFPLPDGHRTISAGVVRKANQAINGCTCEVQA